MWDYISYYISDEERNLDEYNDFEQPVYDELKDYAQEYA